VGMKKNILLFLIFCQIGFAQTFDKTKLDNYFNVLEDNNKFMGTVAISKNGEIIYLKSIGFADIGNSLKATKETKYRIGSISKSFTAVLALKAVENKMLELNQTIDKWFPAIKGSDKITVRQLLNHRSGIYNFTNNSNYLTWNTQSKTENEMVEIIIAGGNNFKPDSKAEYSNSNYVLLTYILEKTFMKSYKELLQEYIIEPIDLKNTYVFGKINTRNNESKSYKFLGSWIEEPETDYTVPLGAGAITSTTSDLIKFADALFSEQLLTTKSLEIMKTVQEGYGNGLFQIPFYSSIGFGHTGGIDGFTSIYSHFPEDNISYALTSNGTNINNNDISIAVLSAVYNKPYEIPEFTSYVPEELDKYLGVYSSDQIPLKITITKDVNTLIAQGTGQPAFPLEAMNKDMFKADQVGAKFEFNPTKKTMILFQNGMQFNFTKP
jgi:D-alanyl-D-alanine carboxypeptidase